MATLSLPPIAVTVRVRLGPRVWPGPPIIVFVTVRSGIGLTVNPIAVAISLAFTGHATGSLTNPQATP
jgi:hypothetical protein